MEAAMIRKNALVIDTGRWLQLPTRQEWAAKPLVAAWQEQGRGVQSMGPWLGVAWKARCRCSRLLGSHKRTSDGWC
jgi:hypothetical protein